MPDAQPKENLSLVRPMSAEEIIFIQLKDLKDEFRDSRKELNARMDRLEKSLDVTRTELNARMDRIEIRQDKLEAKIDVVRKELNARMDRQDEKIDKLDKKFDEKIDKLADKIDSSTRHSQILAGSCLAITITVLLSLFFK